VAQSPSLFWRFSVAATLLWAAVLPMAAWLRDAQSGAVSLFAFLVYRVGGVICHQRPERSFYLGAVPLPVCARCAGIYAGGAAVALVALVGCRLPACSSKKARAWLAAAAAPAALSLLYEWATGEAPFNIIRGATGVPVGAAVAAMVLALLLDEARGGHEP
jgi:uncharacterized membrane protein